MSEDSGEKGASFSRRDFLKVSGAVLGAAVAPRGLEKLGNTEIDVSQEVKVGNLLLTPIITEHTERDWEEHGKEILAKLDQFQIVIPEYFPPEYKHLADNPVMEVSGYEQQNKLFEHLADNLLYRDKDVWVVDPAYSEAAVAFRPLANTPAIVAEVGGANLLVEVGAVAALAHTLPKSYKEEGLSREEIQEKEEQRLKSEPFMKGKRLARAIVTPITLMHSSTIEHSPIEADFRELFVAESLTILGRRAEVGTRAAIVYPQAHWTKIREYLKDDKMREETLKKYIAIKKIPIYTPMFETRHYKAENNHWTKLQGFSIDAK